MKKYVKTFKELVNKVTGPSERDDSSSELSEQSQLTTMQASIPFFKYLEEPTPNEVYASKTNDYQWSSFMKRQPYYLPSLDATVDQRSLPLGYAWSGLGPDPLIACDAADCRADVDSRDLTQ
ncbi:hypothetical protein ACROYT_G015425 [Oculina patagonica]